MGVDLDQFIHILLAPDVGFQHLIAAVSLLDDPLAVVVVYIGVIFVGAVGDSLPDAPAETIIRTRADDGIVRATTEHHVVHRHSHAVPTLHR